VSLTVTVRKGGIYVGAPAKFRRAELDVPSNIYHDQRIGTEGPITLSLSSPYLNVLGTPRIHCACALVDNEVTFHRNLDACQNIHIYAGIFERMRRSMMTRVERCIK
jgi:hypothetical protein